MAFVISRAEVSSPWRSVVSSLLSCASCVDCEHPCSNRRHGADQSNGLIQKNGFRRSFLLKAIQPTSMIQLLHLYYR